MHVHRAGVAHAIVLWHRAMLTAADGLSTAPDDSDADAKQICYYLWPPTSPDDVRRF